MRAWIDRPLASLLFVGIVVAAEPGFAQTARPQSGSAQAMAQMQQLVSENARLQAENADLKRTLDGFRREQDRLGSAERIAGQRLRAAEAAARRVEADAAAKDAQIAELRGRLEELVAKFRETAETLREVEEDRQGRVKSLTEAEDRNRACVARNLELAKIGSELIDRLEARNPLSSLARLEPFTQLKRVQIENLVDEYRGRVEDQLPPTAPAADPRSTSR